MNTILMLAVGSSLMAMGLLILAILWKSRASLQPRPRQVTKEARSSLPSWPSDPPDSAASAENERSQNTSPDLRVKSPIHELAKQLIVGVDQFADEEARRVADADSARVRAAAEAEAQKAEADDRSRAIIAQAEQQSQQVLEIATRRAQDVIQAIPIFIDMVKDEIGVALTNVNNLLPPLYDPVEASHGEVDINNGHVTDPTPISTIGERVSIAPENVNYAEQVNKGPTWRLRGPAGEGVHLPAKAERGRWELKRHRGWSWRDIFWS